MTEILLKIPASLDADSVEELRAALQPYAKVRQLPAQSFDFAAAALLLEFGANALQAVDILAGWLKRTPRGNRAEIRLADGRTFKMEANTDPDAFVKQLKAALKDL